MLERVYIIKNEFNDKVYIGKTFNSIQSRFKEHIRDSRKEHKQIRKLYRAIQKYGEDCFYVELLEDNIPEEELSEKESYYITMFDSYHNGYNNTLGGDGKRYLEVTDEEVIEIYKESKCIRHTAQKLKISEDSVTLILRNNNIETVHPNTKQIIINELNMQFTSLRTCCEYLMENGIANCKDWNSVRVAIKRSIQRNGKYRGYTFTIIE